MNYGSFYLFSSWAFEVSYETGDQKFDFLKEMWKRALDFCNGAKATGNQQCILRVENFKWNRLIFKAKGGGGLQRLNRLHRCQTLFWSGGGMTNLWSLLGHLYVMICWLLWSYLWEIWPCIHCENFLRWDQSPGFDTPVLVLFTLASCLVSTCAWTVSGGSYTGVFKILVQRLPGKKLILSPKLVLC